jgi:3D (Asp-Asp-Asp) domain-containing protein
MATNTQRIDALEKRVAAIEARLPAPPPVTPPPPPPSSGEITVIVRNTAYADQDNDPPGSDAIAYAKSGGHPTVHNQTGGTGTYEDPITCAADVRDYPAGTKLYVPAMYFYGVIEDYCQASVDRHNRGQKPDIIDFFVGGKNAAASQTEAYENSITSSNREVILNPAPGKTVIPGPLFETKRKSSGNTPPA